MEVLKCKKCNNEFPATLEYFYQGAGNKLRSTCKECVKNGVIGNRKKNHENKVSNTLLANKQFEIFISDVQSRDAILLALTINGYIVKFEEVEGKYLIKIFE